MFITGRWAFFRLARRSKVAADICPEQPLADLTHSRQESKICCVSSSVSSCQPSCCGIRIAGSPGAHIFLVDSSCRGLDAIHPEYESRRVRVRHAVAANVFCKAGHVAQRNLQWL